MGLLSRAKAIPVEVTGEIRAEPVERDQPLLDGALDTLAGVLRAFGRFGFATVARDAGTLREVCYAWARHVLTGSAPPGGGEPSRGRAWPEVLRFFSEERAQEQRFVETRLTGLKDVIFEFIDGFRQLHAEDCARREDVAQFLDELERTTRQGSPESIRLMVPRVIGAVRKALDDRNALLDGQMAELGVKLRSLREDLLETRRQLELDPLTGIYNRGAFDATIERFVDLSVFSGQPAVLLLVDVDHFKEINDAHGHPAGDAALRAAADVLVRTFPRKDDFVSRYGGDEFAVLLNLTEAGDEERLVERLLDNLRGLTVVYNGAHVRLTASIGYARPAPGDTSESLVRRADSALYRAKRDGRDRAVGTTIE